MLEIRLQCENVARAQLDSLVLGQVKTNSALNALNGNWTVRTMMAHAAFCLHYDHNNPKILILYEGLGAAPCVLPQGRGALELLNLLMNVGSDHCIRELRKPCESFAIFVGVDRFFMFGHVGGMNSFASIIFG